MLVTEQSVSAVVCFVLQENKERTSDMDKTLPESVGDEAIHQK